MPQAGQTGSCSPMAAPHSGQSAWLHTPQRHPQVHLSLADRAAQVDVSPHSGQRPSLRRDPHRSAGKERELAAAVARLCPSHPRRRHTSGITAGRKWGIPRPRATSGGSRAGPSRVVPQWRSRSRLFQKHITLGQARCPHSGQAPMWLPNLAVQLGQRSSTRPGAARKSWQTTAPREQTPGHKWAVSGCV